MCGIFGGFGVKEFEAQKAIGMIRRGEDGTTVEQLAKSSIRCKKALS